MVAAEFEGCPVTIQEPTPGAPKMLASPGQGVLQYDPEFSCEYRFSACKYTIRKLCG